jgi:hypothetical protein
MVEIVCTGKTLRSGLFAASRRRDPIVPVALPVEYAH